VFGQDARNERGVIFTASNAVAGNAVQVYDRAPNGQLTFARSVATGGKGTGGGLGNQGGLTLSEGHRFLLVVNAGSDDVTVFRISGDRLTPLSRAPSGGKTPVSVTVDDDLVYVLNAGSDNIAGFRLTENGQLQPLAGSTRPLSAQGVGAAEIKFGPGGSDLIVTEKATNRIVAYPVGRDGLPAAQPIVTASNGKTPFGFDFARDRSLIVSEAVGGAANAGTVSSYRLARSGLLSVVTASAPDKQSAPCWIAVTPDRRFAYTTNTASSTISGYRVDEEGALALLDATVSAGANSGPIDLTIAGAGRFLYALGGKNQTIVSFLIGPDGSLSAGSVVSGLPGAANGLVGY
jgi:6-phosphogluconolactonase (cycloisomerase 2 family)